MCVVLLLFTPASGCNAEYTDTRGRVTSPNYPEKYENGLDCTYNITATAGSTIDITFPDFGIEEHFVCQWDWLKVMYCAHYNTLVLLCDISCIYRSYVR